MLLHNLSIKHKLLSMLILPMFSLLVFSSVILIDKTKQVTASNALIKDAEFFAQIGATIHNLQKERGTSVSFVSSKGAKMMDKLPIARADSDKTLNTLIISINNHSSTDKSVQNVLGTLNNLKDIREKVNTFQFDGLVCATQYTEVVKSLLELTNTVGKSTKNAEIMRGANTYSAYLNMKERAGRERANLAGIFAIDKMDLPHLLKLSGNLGESNASLQQFLQLATPAQIEFYKKTVTGKAIDEVEVMRKRVLESDLNTSLGVDNTYWFDMASERINLMKKVEDKLVDDLRSNAVAIKSAATQTLIIVSILTLFVILLAIISIAKVTTAIVTPLQLMKDTLVNVNKSGDFAKRLDYQSLDEIGETAAAFNSMMATLQEALSNVNKVMESIAHGEFNIGVDIQANGDINKLKESVNETVGQLRITMFTLNDVMNSLYNADFAKVIVTNAKGNYKQILDKAISSQEALRIMLNDIGEVMENVAAGDLNHRVTADGRGELLTLKDNINSTLISLGCLDEIVLVSRGLANGDLTQSISTQYPGVFGQVTTSINETVANLKNLIRDIDNAVDIIGNAAQEIASGNSDLSNRTEEQAASLEETTSNMGDLTQAVSGNNLHATQANKMADDAAKIATHGVNSVNSVITTMAEINDSAHHIVDIISVIDDIAFQTNILALNAAVEAARAGESGKGFAVVATEVRNLAQRAANAAGEIKRLIDNSVERVSGGSKQVAEAGQTMTEIVSSIKNVSAMISEITVASTEQSTEIDQVYQSIRRMEDVTQQNAALVEQAAASAESLEDQTRDLIAALKHFKV